MAAKHTPAPWVVYTSDEGKVWIEETNTRDRLIIADIPGDMETYGAEEMANARLIAAAPEMHAILRDIRARLTSRPISTRAEAEGYQAGLVCRLQKTLAQIEGEA